MCTGLRFTDDQGNLFYGRNLDVESSYGEKVLVTPRNYALPYKFRDDRQSQRAIIGMGIMAGKYPMYFDACNEDGLCIAGLNFPKLAHFSDEPVDGKLNLTPYELMLWVCDEFETVAAVKDALKDVNLVNKPFAPQMPVAPLHWLISDAKAAITVEMSADKGLQVYDNQVGVLTNSPDFEWHVKNLMNYAGLTPNDAADGTWSKQAIASWGVGTGSYGLPGDSLPASRFVKVAYLNANYPTVSGEEANVAKFFNILKNVAMVRGSVTNQNGKDEYTVYTGCYSQATKTYYYNTENDFTIKSAQLTEANMTASEVTTY